MTMNIRAIYDGSDGQATRELYVRLCELGPAGLVAMNLFRACKCSGRAKVYRGGIRGAGSFRSMAYERKQWSMNNACKVLSEHAKSLGISWGWKDDPAQEFHRWVLYVDLPTGQVSFHTDRRGEGPDYAGEWDQVRDASPSRIIEFTQQVFSAAQTGGGA
jgi:hypothetical protein